MSDMRAELARVAEHLVAYRASLDERPHRPLADYREMVERFAEPTPEKGIPAAAMLEELIGKAEDGLMSIAGPRFFGWVMGSSDMRGVLADMLVGGWGQNTGYHQPTPAMAAIEEVVETWLVDLLDLPRRASIGFATGATVANATCLAAARTAVLRAAGHDPDADGLFGAPEVAVLIGEDAHSSVFSALQLIGFGYARVTRVATDAQGRMRPDDLAAKLAAAGAGPKIVIAQAGQINTGAFDPFAEIVPLARQHGAWVHVDGAFGLWARAAPALRQLTDGVEGADSWATDGHKWLQVPYDCGFAIVADREAHQRAMTNWASYLPTIGPDDRVPSAFVPELSRRARATPVWAMLKCLGREGVAELVERHCAQARQLAELLAAERGVEVLNEVVLNQVIVRFGEGSPEARDEATRAVIAAVQEEGTLFAGGAQWRGEWVMRLSVTSGATRAEDIERAAATIASLWRAVAAKSA